MRKPESVRVIEMHKRLWYLKKQMDHPIQTRRPDLVLINKKKRPCPIVDFVKVEKNQKVGKISGSFQRGKRMLRNMKVTVISIMVGDLGMVPKIGFEK